MTFLSKGMGRASVILMELFSAPHMKNSDFHIFTSFLFLSGGRWEVVAGSEAARAKKKTGGENTQTLQVALSWHLD